MWDQPIRTEKKRSGEPDAKDFCSILVEIQGFEKAKSLSQKF